MLGDEVLQAEVGSLLEQVFNILKLFLALNEVVFCDLALVCLELEGHGREIEGSGMEDIINFISDEFHPFLKF